jgi:hypothetical protein
MAAKDEQGQLREVPTLQLSNETQLRRFCEGKAIRKLSLQKREYLKANLEGIDMQERMAMTIDERVEVTFSS